MIYLIVNVISDRGTNFMKEFAAYAPVYCFGHRLNNILKICFFQQQNKDQSNETTTDNQFNADADFIVQQEII